MNWKIMRTGKIITAMATNSLNFRRGACALFLFFIVSTGLYGNEPSVHVLCYHAFKGDSNIFSFSLEELKSHIEHLKSHGYTFVTLDDVTNKRFTGTKNILVTVDDGNKSVYDAYFTVFKQYRIKPLLSIYPAVIEKKDYALTWKQLKELSDEGCSVAAHGFYHQKINRKLYESNRKMFDGEIYHSRDVLEQKLGKKIDVFVYPFGIASDITIQTLKAAGFRYGFTINCGGLSAGMLDSGLRYELPRYMFTRSSQKMNLGLIARNMIYHKKKTVAHEETSEQKKSARAADVKPVEEKRIAVRFQGTEKKTEADLVYIQKLFDKYRSIEKSYEKAYAFLNEARAELDIFRDSMEKTSLLTIADYVLRRRK